VTSAEEMRQAVLARSAASTIVIKAAAVADYRPKVRAAEKLKKSDQPLILELVKNPDILGELGKAKKGEFLVGFAAETFDLAGNARKKLTEKNLDLVVANDVSQPGAGFNVDTNIVKLLARDGSVEELPLLTKDELAELILDRIVALKKG